MSKLIHDRTVVYNVGYHLVWSVKCRKRVLCGQIEDALLEILYDIAREKGFDLKEIEIMPDYVHIFASAKPKFSPSYIFKMLKGISARRLFLRHPELKQQLWGGHLWNPSTYVETVGHISQEVVRKYIENQKTK